MRVGTSPNSLRSTKPARNGAWLPGTMHHSFRSGPTCCNQFSHTLRLFSSDMRRDVQEIFRATPHHKQVMMFSATLAKEIRATCKKFMANVSIILA
jgi:hypothetical protein